MELVFKCEPSILKIVRRSLSIIDVIFILCAIGNIGLFIYLNFIHQFPIWYVSSLIFLFFCLILIPYISIFWLLCYNYDRKTTIKLNSETGNIEYENLQVGSLQTFNVNDIQRSFHLCSRSPFSFGYTEIVFKSGESLFITDLISIKIQYKTYPYLHYKHNGIFFAYWPFELIIRIISLNLKIKKSNKR